MTLEGLMGTASFAIFMHFLKVCTTELKKKKKEKKAPQLILHGKGNESEFGQTGEFPCMRE